MAGSKTDRKKPSASRRSPPARKKPPPRKKRSRAPTGTGRRAPAARKPVEGDTTLADHLRDIWGIGLLVVAALAALGLYADAAGIVGVYLQGALRGVFGVFGLAAPPILVAAGVLLLREPRDANVRVVTGVGLVFVGSLGLWHLARGAPGFDGSQEALWESAGLAGAAVSLPLRAAAATGGAAVLLVALVTTGLLLATATPPRVIVEHAVSAARALRDRLAERRARRALEAEAAAADAQSAAEAEEADRPTDVLSDAVDAAQTTELAEASPDDDDAGLSRPELSDTQLLPAGVATDQAGTATMLAPPAEDWANYRLPDMSLLRTGREAVGNKRELEQMRGALERTLRQFNVGAEVSRMSRGPTVTRFEVTLEPGTKVAAVTKLGDDISYALATPEIRIVAPIPGKSAIGVEVPNRDRDLITLGDVLRLSEAEKPNQQLHPLAVGVGKDIAGHPVMVNLASMPHLLIAGATGSGKSVTMNAIVTSLLMRTRPDQVRMILVDPKRVELNNYEGVPHLLNPVVTDPKRATEALDWTVKEMEQRYERLAMLGYRNIDSYNTAVRDQTVRQAPALSGEADTIWEPLPYIVFVIDELSDLMMIAPRDVENHIVRISQMARAVGIHLIVATQRPSVDVVTGLIKANVPSRIALAMATGHDSKTILDQYGAEKLVGHGDMLFMPANASKPHRIQGCYVDEDEIERIVEVCKSQRQADYAPGVVKTAAEARRDVTGDDASDADLTTAAMELVVRSGLGSTSMLQRKLKVGFARAGRLMDELEQMGVVAESVGPKARQVLMSVEELEERLGADGGDAPPTG